MPTVVPPIRTSEHIGISMAAIVTVYLNGVAQRSIDITLIPPPPASLLVRAADSEVTSEARGLSIVAPLPSLALNVRDGSSAIESYVAGFQPSITFTREVRVSERTKTGETVVP